MTSSFNVSPQGFQGQTGPPGPAGVVGPQVRVAPTGLPSFAPVWGYLRGGEMVILDRTTTPGHLHSR